MNVQCFSFIFFFSFFFCWLIHSLTHLSFTHFSFHCVVVHFTFIIYFFFGVCLQLKRGWRETLKWQVSTSHSKWAYSIYLSYICFDRLVIVMIVFSKDHLSDWLVLVGRFFLLIFNPLRSIELPKMFLHEKALRTNKKKRLTLNTLMPIYLLYALPFQSKDTYTRTSTQTYTKNVKSARILNSWQGSFLIKLGTVNMPIIIIPLLFQPLYLLHHLLELSFFFRWKVLSKVVAYMLANGWKI